MAYDHIFYEFVKHVYSHDTTPLTLCVTPSGHEKRMHTTWHSLHQGPYISQTAHTWWAARHNSGRVEGGSSMSRIQTPVWPQTCSVEFMSGLCADQSVTSKSCCPRKALVPCAVLGMVFYWTYTKFGLKTPVALGSIPSWRSLMWHWRLRVPSSTTIHSSHGG